MAGEPAGLGPTAQATNEPATRHCARDGSAPADVPRWDASLAARVRQVHDEVSEALDRGVTADVNRHVGGFNSVLREALAGGVVSDILMVSALPARVDRVVSSADASAKLIDLKHASGALLERLTPPPEPPGSPVEPGLEWAAARILRLCDRFHTIAQELARPSRGRRPMRPPRDEYDVQTLLRAMLRVDFDDVRAEEWAPSYAAAGSRMDFLILPYGIVLETKMTRKSLAAGKIGEELIVDVQRYQAHPACRWLHCFIYDPNNQIANPRGLEADLAKLGGGKLPVGATVRP